MKVTAEFNPQAWVGDVAIDVDPEGPTAWDASAFATEHVDYVRKMMDRTPDGAEVLDNDDLFKGDPAAPEWVREWYGPCSTYLTIAEEASLFQFEARASDDELKSDLELTCTECGEVLCDIEDGDNMGTLVSVVNDHKCKGEGA